MCALGNFGFGKLVADLLFSLIIVAGVLTTFKQRWVGFLVIVLAAASLALTWLNHLRPDGSLIILGAGLGADFCGLSVGGADRPGFGEGPVTARGFTAPLWFTCSWGECGAFSTSWRP